MPITASNIQQSYGLARDRFAEEGVDCDRVLQLLDTIPISIQCWQGDDVLGFENPAGKLTGGIQTSGNYPGRARCGEELRDDLDRALAQIPGAKRVNLHAIYLESDAAVDRTEIRPEHFSRWTEWARQHGLGLDFNPTCFSHPNSADNLTLTHPDPAIRRYWIEHCKASRTISEHFGTELGTTSIMNIWVPDGFKDTPFDRLGPRQRLAHSLDEILAATPSESVDHHKVAVEGKLFGIGAESYTAGTNDFYLAYASSRKTLLTLDAGHFHPTESVADKISTALCFVEELLLHVSRPVRWDSDHVVMLDEATIGIAQEIVRCNALDRVHVGLDFFDASINRVAAWIIGARNMRKALLIALLEPAQALRSAENRFDFTARLALMEEQKSLPWGAVWDYYCESRGVGVGGAWLGEIREYESSVLRKRS